MEPKPLPDPGTVDLLVKKALERAAQLRHFPESTYRLQFHKGFTFDDAAAICDYLAALGVTHAYASPYLKARPGSTHGYDVIDHCTLNPELGGERGFQAFVQALRDSGLRHILDTVPNHVGVATNDNGWWNGVLENGPASRFGRYFDIEWEGSPRPELHGRVLLPVLGAPYAEVLEKGELQLRFERETGAFAVYYYDRRFPISPRRYAMILCHGINDLSSDREELLAICSAPKGVPDRPEPDRSLAGKHHRHMETIKRWLGDLAHRSAAVRDHIDRAVRAFNGRPGDARSFDLLDELLSRQCYRLTYWRNASDEINYRRFFDINDLAALSMQRRELFEDAHAFIMGLLAEGQIAGLRIDHPDGLFDPREYFDRLQRYFVFACAEWVCRHEPAFHGIDCSQHRAAVLERVPATSELRAAFPAPGYPLYVVAEKILAVGEALPADWAVHGTSGYDFLNVANGLFVDRRGEEPLTRLYEEFTGDTTSFEELVYRKKRLILETSLSSELHMLAHRLDRLAQMDRHWQDFTLRTLRTALREMIACFPVYRPYIAPNSEPTEVDRRQIDAGIEGAMRREPSLPPAVFGFIRDALLQAPPAGNDSPEMREGLQMFAGRFQQLTAPATAKGVEDTAFYAYHRLISLNEVGGDPAKFGFSASEVHDYLADRQARWPYAMSALSTHDTKRSEDVRARLNVLSELADEWRGHVTRWRELNAGHRTGGSPSPDEEYLLYQTVLGAWPLEPYGREEFSAFVERVQAYMTKAMREAKLRTSWTDPNEAHEKGVTEFVARILDPQASGEFMESFRAFQRKVADFGLVNSLAQTVLRLAAPGVPDTYQGTELWDFSLVDPDNRRPVDYGRRRDLLGEVGRLMASPERDLGSLWASRVDGRIKLLITAATLGWRRRYPGLFTVGRYVPATIEGDRADHVFAFAREHDGRYAVVVLPRLVASLGVDPNSVESIAGALGGTRITVPGLPTGVSLRNLYTGAACPHDRGTIDAADAFAGSPVALLVQD